VKSFGKFTHRVYRENGVGEEEKEDLKGEKEQNSLEDQSRGEDWSLES